MVSDEVVTQLEFAADVGISQQAVSELMKAGVLAPGGTEREWLLAYCVRLREQAAGRMGTGGDLDLVQERAALARAQREGQELKNAVASGTYAPIELLADVLATAAVGVVSRLDQIPATLRRMCPDLPPAARDAVMREIASARNEMVRKTENLVADMLDEGDQPIEDEPADLAADDGALDGQPD